MGTTTLRRYTAAAALVALTALSACTVHDQPSAPALTGPSDSATSLQIHVTPDTIFQDGASQALVTITAFGPKGQPLPNLSLRMELSVNGSLTDFGTLSAKSLVTDASGRAAVTYTAPPPVAGVSTVTIVEITARPVTNDFANTNPRTTTIRLIPTGTLTSLSPFRPAFTVPAATLGDPVFFQGSAVDASGANASNQIASFIWDFGDGGTATGSTVSHTFRNSGTFPVTLTIIDLVGRGNRLTQTVTVSPGANPTASFTISPAPPATVGQTLNFNASASSAAPGHSITNFDWDFGDGTTGGGTNPTHAFGAAGTFVVTLTVRDDVGRKAITTQNVTVVLPVPTAAFTFSPSSPTVNQQVVFDASNSRAASGRTIVGYSWNFDDGTVGTGQTTRHTYSTAGTYRVLLTVTDDLGQTGQTTQNVTVK